MNVTDVDTGINAHVRHLAFQHTIDPIICIATELVL